ncbi:MAG: amino acid adenylation domain-containing protein [Verrucomicrobia bacterium]|nr:amino acid adenylation domain-containing protein [Verrucomicrobiota bacterium]
MTEETLQKIRDKLETLKRNKSRTESDPSARSEPSIIPLTPAQKQLYAFQLLNPGSTAYNMPVAIEIQGALDVPRLKSSFSKLIQRHQLLSSSVIDIGGELIFRSASEKSFVFEEEVLGEKNLDSKDSDVVKKQSCSAQPAFKKTDDSNDFGITMEKWIFPFDLTNGPLIHVKLLHLAQDLYVLFIDVPHLIGDATSLDLLLGDLFSFYEKKSLPKLKSTFHDYVAWRKQLTESQAYQDQKKYWEKLLEGETSKLQFPIIERQLDEVDRRGELVHFSLSIEQTIQLRQTCRDLKVTPYMFLMACYQVFLSKICSCTDIVLGTSNEGRTHPSFKGIFGLLVNTIPIRGFPSEFKKFSEFLDEIKARCIEGFENQYFWFSDLEISAHSNSTFETLFDFHRSSKSEIELEALSVRIVPPALKESKFALSLEGFDQENQVAFHFEYQRKLFHKKQIDLFVKQFISILTQSLNHPEKRISELDICLESHKESIVRDFNKISDVEPDQLFLDAFEEQVKKNPSRIAVNQYSSQLSYEFLDDISSHLAKVFIARGVREGDCIAFHLNRGIDFLIAMIGVFKAGACYVPLDLNSPVNRRISILEQCSPKLMLSEDLLDWSPCANSTVKALLEQPVQPFPSKVAIDRETLAYIIFTSGSTGKPKGAMIEHRGMMNHMLAKIEDFQLGEEETIAQTSSQTFDVSVWQFITSLVLGARVSVFNDDDAWTTLPLLRELEKSRVTVFETVPSHMRLVLDEMKGEKIGFTKELKYLILNGEPLPPSICAESLNQYPDLIISNAYGPTECSDDVTHHFIRKKAPQNRRSIPIGLPVRNCPIMIMDSSLSLLSEGLSGELCVGGLGVCRGYLNNPIKTAEVFVPNPFGIAALWSHRIYRTGDLAFKDFEGIFEHLGRKDYQIKFNGQRIELGEIEAIISAMDNVSQCAVAVIGDSQNRQLGAYLLVREDVDLNQIREKLKKELPEFMIPAKMMKVKSFPHLPSGKLDRKSLPAFETVNNSIEITPLNTETEKGLSEIWKELFKSTEIGKESHFFEMGGHSLMAIQLAGGILKTFSVKLSMRSIYQYPRLMDLADHIDELVSNKVGETNIEFPQIDPDQREAGAPFPLTNVQQAYWLGRKGIYALGDVSVHVYSEYDCRDLDLNSLEAAWNEMICRHGALRIVIEEDGNQKILPEVPYYKFEIKDCKGISNKESENVLKEMRSLYSHEVFPSDKWPLFAIRAAILPGKIRLFLSFDALIMDGWSVDLLFGEWMTLYRNPDAILPNLKLSFRDCVLAIAKLQNHPLYQADRNYWIKRVDNFPSAPMLPIEKSPDQIVEQLFSRCSKRLPKNQWLAIQESIKKLQLSPTGFLCFVFSEILSLFTGEDHFALNLTLFDRPPLHSEINSVVGDFTTLTLLEVKRDPSVNFGKRARILQDQLWADLDHRLFGGIEFIRELSKVRSERGEATNFPVVLTSVLGLDDKQNVDLTEEFGEEVFSITQTPQVWLDFKAYEIHGDLVVEWDFVKELFRPDFVEAMHTLFITELKEFASNPQRWLSCQNCLPPNEQLIERAEYNLTARTFDLKPLHKLLNGQQEAAAIITENEILTYRDLSRNSEFIAAQLINTGVKTGDIVAIVMDKNWHQPVAAMGILKAGAVYLPIDAHLPTKRIDQLLTISGAKYLVIQSEFANKIQEIPSAQNLPNDHIISLEKNITSAPEVSDLQIELAESAYIIFTSGSTGTPKGVVMQHGPVANTICDLVQRYRISAEDQILGLSNLNFDLSVFDIFGAFCAGAALVLPSQQYLRDASYWFKLIRDYKVTIWNSVPMLMQMMVEFLESDPSISLENWGTRIRLILLSGDWIPVDLPRKINKYFPNARIISLGGATEAAIWSIHYEIDPLHRFEKSIPYGYPLANQQFHILSDDLQPVPDRVPGKLFIGGAGLAKGYFNDAEKTDSVFIHHPQFGRLYSTGDIGAYHPEIGIEFLGRKDSQVKIRGHRIELAEVEYAIKQHPLVESCVALVIGNRKHSQTLVACTVSIEDSSKISTLENVISDPNQRIDFQLKQHGLENPSNKDSIISLPEREKPSLKRWRKSLRQFSLEKLSKYSFERWLSSLSYQPMTKDKTQNLDRNNLFELLSKIQVQANQNPLPKYPYPSAGSLYPVQAHLGIGKDIELPRGKYVFNPKERLLIQNSTQSVDEKSSLKLIGKKEAIEPLYGPFSDLLCTIEAGYMFALLDRFLEEKNIGYSLKIDPCPELSFNSGSSKPIPSIDLEILIYLKEGKVEEIEGGWYRFDPKTNRLIKQDGNTLLFHPSNEDSFAIFQEAAGGIFFLNHGQDMRHSAFWSGFFGQRLMDSGCDYLIGSCPLARIDGTALDAIRSITDATAVHYLLFGSATEEQFSSVETSKIRPGAYEKMIQDFVGETLPSYMVPLKIEQISTIPLTPNGKVDRSDLAKRFDLKSNETKQKLLPRTPIEKKIHTIWSEILEKQDIGIEDSFFELGGNSLTITKMALKVKQVFNLEIPLAEFFKATKISLLADVLEKKKNRSSAKEESSLETDIQLSSKIQFPKNESKSGNAILLTGSSGFLGIHLISDLLKRSSGTVYCHVRAHDKQSALARLKGQADLFNLTKQIDFNRIHPVIGDLKESRLGMDLDLWKKLSADVGVIIHNGCFVHHVYDYETLRQTNVKSTLELIQFCTDKPKRLVYISSILSMIDRDKEGELIEDFPSGNNSGLYGGYQKTKWASEMMLKEAKARGLDVLILRPNTISGQSDSGRSSYAQDHFFRLIKGCIQIGYAPIWDEVIDLQPVDRVSQIIAHCSLEAELPISVINLKSKNLLNWVDLINWINKNFAKIELISAEKWQTEHLSKIDSSNALYPLLGIYMAQSSAEHFKMVASTTRSSKYLDSKNLRITEVSEAYLHSIFDFLKRESFL